MKSILCFGDSLTWGFNPKDGSRHPFHHRWTGVVQQMVDDKARVVEEGLNGRTTMRDDPYLEDKNGAKHLPVILESHRPLDLIVLALGSNDLKSYFKLSAKDITLGCMGLIRTIQRSPAGVDGKPAKILLVSPPHVKLVGGLYDLMMDGAVEKSQELGRHYKELASSYKCGFVDAAEYVVSSPIDGGHLEADQSVRLGEVIGERVLEMI